MYSYYKYCIVFMWPLLSFGNVSTNIILSFILFMADVVTDFNKNRRMVYSEYHLVRGHYPKNVRGNVWLACVIFTKTTQNICLWSMLTSVHIFSPWYNLGLHVRSYILYSSLVLYFISRGVYERSYKKWVVHYSALSTHDTEAGIGGTKLSD